MNRYSTARPRSIAIRLYEFFLFNTVRLLGRDPGVRIPNVRGNGTSRLTAVLEKRRAMEAPNTWHFPYFNEAMGHAVGEGFASSDAMLMGRVNYQEWAAYWPGSTDQPVADIMNNMPKYVVSTRLERAWQRDAGRVVASRKSAG